MNHTLRHWRLTRLLTSALLMIMAAAAGPLLAATPLPEPGAPVASVPEPSALPVPVPVPVPETAVPGATSVADVVLNTTRSTVRSSAEWLARGVDGWFGDIPFAQGGKVSDGEVAWNLYKREDQGVTRGVRFKARFRLPNLESHTYVFVGNDDRREIVSDQPDAFSHQQQLLRADNADNAFFAGIGAALMDVLDFRLGFRAGLKPYAQGRYRHPWQFGPADRVEFRETVFYSAADRLGSTTALSYEHSLSPNVALRWVQALTATQASRDSNWSSNAGVYRTFGEQRVLALEALVGGVLGSPVAVPDYGLQAKWSQPLYGQDLLGDLIVGHFWPRPEPSARRGQAWAVGTGVRLQF